MNDSTDDELLSAYLDGELSDEELLRAERLLAERPECRQLVDELRAIGGGLQRLPKHALDEEFAQRVLRRAEREMLASAATDKPAARERAGHVARPAIPLDDRLTWNRWRRPLVWSGLAVAAALLIMFFGPQPIERPVAQGPAPHADAGARPMLEVDREQGEVARFGPGMGGQGGGGFGGGAVGGQVANDLEISNGATAAGATVAESELERLSKLSGDTNAAGADALWQKTAKSSDHFAALKDRESEKGAQFYYLGLDTKDGFARGAESFGDDVVIVKVRVESPAAGKQAFRKLLKERQIAWAEKSADEIDRQDAAAGPSDTRKRDEKVGAKGEAPPAAASPATTPPVEPTLELHAGQKERDDHRFAGRQRESEQFKLGEEGEGREALTEAFLVDASQADVDALVSGLVRQGDVVHEVVIDPPVASDRKGMPSTDASGANRYDWDGDGDVQATQEGQARRHALNEIQAQDAPAPAAPSPVAPVPTDPKQAVKDSATLGASAGRPSGGTDRAKESTRDYRQPRQESSTRGGGGQAKPHRYAVEPPPAQVPSPRVPGAPASGSEKAASAPTQPPPAAVQGRSALAEGKSSPATPHPSKDESRPGEGEVAPPPAHSVQDQDRAQASFGRVQEILLPESALDRRDRQNRRRDSVSDNKPNAPPESAPNAAPGAAPADDSAVKLAAPAPASAKKEPKLGDSDQSVAAPGLGKRMAPRGGAESGKKSEPDGRKGKGTQATDPQSLAGDKAKPPEETRGGQRAPATESAEGLADQSQKKLAAAPARRRAIFVFEVQPPEVASPVEQAAPAPAKP